MIKRSVLITVVILTALPSFAFAWCNDCGGGDCCGCPGEAQCLGSYSSCEEACGLVSSYTPPPRDYAAEAAAAAAAEAERVARQERYDRAVAGNALNDQGNVAWKSGNLTAAIAYYRQALEKRPDDAVINQNLARVSAQLEQEEAERREKERVRAQKEQENRDMVHGIQNVVDGFSLSGPPAVSAGKPDLVGANTAPDAFGTQKAAPVLKFGEPAQDLSEKSRDWFNKVGEAIYSKRDHSARAAAIDNDPRMVEADKQLSGLKIERDRIKQDIASLGKQMNAAAGPVQKKELADKQDQKFQEMKEKVTEISQKEETKKKLHRTIDTEIEQKAKK